MLRTPARSHSRRGAVLIVVLAMLVLFAVLGLSFVLYSEAQLSAARGVKLSRNEETEPNPQAAAEGYLGGLIYDVGDTGDDLANPIRGHSLARSKYGYQAGVAGVLPYDADPLAKEQVETGPPIIKGAERLQAPPPRTTPFNFNGILDNRQILRYTWDPTSGMVFDPERFYGADDFRRSPTAALNGAYSGKDYAFTYPDRHDYYLAFQEPATGRILLPSFHRDVFGPLDPSNANWTNTPGKFLTLRPRPGAVDGHVNFPPVPPNPDGTYTGDVQNMRYTSGAQHNDSLWMDAGGPVLRWRGKNYKAMVAPLVLDLSARVNLSVAGNLHNPRADRQSAHASGMGWGPWEVNPAEIVPDLALPAGANPPLAAVVRARYGIGATVPPADPYTGASVSRINDGRQPPSYSRVSLRGSGPGSTANPQYGPIGFPPPGSTLPFPLYPDAFSFTQSEVNSPLPGFSLDLTRQDHASQFNPLLYTRRGTGAAPGGLGLNALVAAASRFDDPRGRTAAYPLPAPLTGGTSLPQANALLTSFSTSQQFATVRVNTAGGGTTVLGPVDVNRKLADYRINPALPLSPANIWPTASAEYRAARRDRQNLARDVFVRLCAADPSVRASATYDPTSGYLINPTGSGVRNLAIAAACIVDAVDPDDIQTLFVFNPDPSTFPAQPDPLYDPADYTPNLRPEDNLRPVSQRVVFGHELHRLRLNEAYTCVVNDPADQFPNGRASRPLKRQYWVELVNPTPAEPDVNTGTAARSDRGAARLAYDPTTLVPNPANPSATVPAVAAAYNVYRLEATEVTYYQNPPVGKANWDDRRPRVQIDTFAQAGAVAKAGGTATGDQQRVVAIDGPLAAPDNAPYFLIGPQADFPGGVKSTLNLTDAAGVPAGPVNALQYDLTAGPPTAQDIANAQLVYPEVRLSRLTNPYQPVQADPAQPNYNPFLLCDQFEHVPTRDRTTATDQGGGRAPSNAPSIGKLHPYEKPTYNGVLLPVVNEQVGGAGVPNTFLAANNPLDNRIGGGGLQAFFFPDRQVVCPDELTLAAGPLNIQAGNLGYYRSPNYTGGYYDDYSSTATLPPGLLATTPPLPGAATGGRAGGKLNINTVHDPRTFLALLDPQPANAFGRSFATTFAQQFLTGAPPPPVPPGTFAVPGWSGRTPGGRPGITNFEMNDGPPSPLRDTPMTAKQRYWQDYYWQNTGLAVSNPLTGQEPGRKMWNSLSTISDSFLIVMTVGFFEVENAGPWTVTTQPVLGRELFDKVSGDLRVQFAGVLDRSCLALADPTTSFTAPGDAMPFQTRLTLDAGAGSSWVEIEAVPPATALPPGFSGAVPANTCGVLGNGSVWPVTQGTRLWVGYGVSPTLGDGEWLTVTGVTAGSRAGTATLTLAANTTRARGSGTLVTSLPFGNPGPQPGVTLGQLQRRGVLPYFTRLDP